MPSFLLQQPATQISAVVRRNADGEHCEFETDSATSKITTTTFTKTGSSGSSATKCKHMVAEMKAYMTLYVTKQLYPKIKFPPDGEQRLNAIGDCMVKHNVKLPDGVSKNYFKSYFYDKFSTVFSTLRHNGQTLARRRYLGRYTHSKTPVRLH